MTEPYLDADGLVRVYPAHQPDGTGIVWAHGGGFAHGDLDMPESDWVARQLAERGTTVVSVDYRLAPTLLWGRMPGEEPRAGEHYPAASDDMLAAWSWTVENAERLGIDTDRLAIGGTSAGGNLSAGAVLRLREQGAPTTPALVVLAYPSLHAVQPAPGPELRAALDADPEADRFGPEVVRGMYENYLGGAVDDAPLGAIPGRATPAELADFPPTLMINSDADELRVSGEAFAAALREADCEIDVVTEPGTQHGHLNRPAEPAASASIDRIAGALAALSTRLPSTSS